MVNSFSKESIPQELISYKKILDTVINCEDKENGLFTISSQAVLNRDARGRLVSAGFYNVDNELYKQVFFNGDNIESINYYRNDRLTCREFYEANKVCSKYLYKKDGSCVYEYHYGYDALNRTNSICRKCLNNEVLAAYEYDSIDRIISRKIYLNKDLILNQSYGYDVLNRVTEYSDENQTIFVSGISNKNELLSYTITDKMENKIIITNHFTCTGYLNTEYTLNGHSVTVVDKSFVDNIMLKKPVSNEDDLDLIISGLCNNSRVNSCLPMEKESVAVHNSMSLIDKNIELKILPISIRKRVLYNIAMKSV